MKQNKKPYVIGIIGGAGVGKTFVGQYMCQSLHGHFIEADKIGHQVLKQENVIKMIVNRFGQEIVKAGGIDRRELGNIVFNDNNHLIALNKIVHPIMYDVIESHIRQTDSDYVVLEAAVMIEAKFYHLVDKMILLTSNDKVRMNRLINKRMIAEEKAKAMIQAENDAYMDYADEVVDTSDDIQGYKEELDRILNTIQEENNETP